MGISQHQSVKKISIFSLLSNILLATVKWIAGIFGNSYALIADAIESSVDIISSFVVFMGLRYSSRPADDDHPYGHGRIEPMITFFVVLIMIGSAVVIAYQSLELIFKSHPLPKEWTLLVVTCVIVWKEVSFQLVMKRARKLQSSSLRAEAWHHRSDAITSLFVFVGISLALFLGKGYEYMDDIAALIASLFIVYNAFHIFRPAWGEIMDENSYEDFKEQIKLEARIIPEINCVEKCNIRKVGIYFYIDLHLEVNGQMSVRNGHEIAHQFKDLLMIKYAQIADVLIHIEPSREVKANS